MLQRPESTRRAANVVDRNLSLACRIIRLRLLVSRTQSWQAKRLRTLRSLDTDEGVDDPLFWIVGGARRSIGVSYIDTGIVEAREKDAAEAHCRPRGAF